MTSVVAEIEWVELERGYGQRPDGFTYHPSLIAAQKYIDQYWNSMPGGDAPDIYSRPSPPELVEVDPVFKLLVQGKGMIYMDSRYRQP